MTKFITGRSTQKNSVFLKIRTLDSLKFFLGPMDFELLRIVGFNDQALCLAKLLMSIGSVDKKIIVRPSVVQLISSLNNLY